MARSEFTAKTKGQARERARLAGDLCECGCGLPLTVGKVEYHHVLEDVLGGEPTLANCWAVTKACHDRITASRAPILAKVKRQARAHDNATVATSRPIPARGFPTAPAQRSASRRPAKNLLPPRQLYAPR